MTERKEQHARKEAIKSPHCGQTVNVCVCVCMCACACACARARACACAGTSPELDHGREGRSVANVLRVVAARSHVIPEVDVTFVWRVCCVLCRWGRVVFASIHSTRHAVLFADCVPYGRGVASIVSCRVKTAHSPRSTQQHRLE
jgi:hypothetical protein